ncbi:glycosyltransferase [Arthrobacter sp. CDRTa11]|uniref:glycosyltransferase n=1 Tax=Arthrobacter sp. CDRTa11 TaxID=2651199 RepID=UPI002265F386|nr:glycosyltransferase [Arthrobacter sp. CDRTa11]UZX04337.1 glycosyltransferase [Arthrobacter sp. CDRTa11]
MSEMSLKYAPLTWALSRIYGAIHIVDGFIGLYETDVEDKNIIRAGSLKAKILKLQDRLAVELADIYVVDTEVRADRVRTEFGQRHIVYSLPVGSPSWAQPSEYKVQDGTPQVLYYGNYIPLHGLNDYVAAISQIPPSQRPLTKMIGSGDCYDGILAMVNQRGLSDFFSFHEAVPEYQLAAEIANAKVVLGIFGSSSKAASVIANKVWQGLACSRRVITRQSRALDEISELAGDLLIQVPAADPTSLGTAILIAVEADSSPAATGISQELEAYVLGKFDHFLLLVNQEIDARTKSRVHPGAPIT